MAHLQILEKTAYFALKMASVPFLVQSHGLLIYIFVLNLDILSGELANLNLNTNIFSIGIRSNMLNTKPILKDS